MERKYWFDYHKSLKENLEHSIQVEIEHQEERIKIINESKDMRAISLAYDSLIDSQIRLDAFEKLLLKISEVK